MNQESSYSSQPRARGNRQSYQQWRPNSSHNLGRGRGRWHRTVGRSTQNIDSTSTTLSGTPSEAPNSCQTGEERNEQTLSINQGITHNNQIPISSCSRAQFNNQSNRARGSRIENRSESRENTTHRFLKNRSRSDGVSDRPQEKDELSRLSQINENVDPNQINAPNPPDSCTSTTRSIYPRRFIRNRNIPSAESQSAPNVIQSEISENQLRSNTFECMICCDNIHRFNPIWFCSNCYNIFHLKCAIEWCNKSIKSRNEAIENAQFPSLSGNETAPNSSFSRSGYTDYHDERLSSVEWPCPACREVLHSKPSKYKCFCGKVVRPEVNRHLTPHSCGQICGRKRPNADCPHSCNSICHPGRCNPCPLTSKKSCFCGKITREVKCSVDVESCNQICARPLNCGQHYCMKTCHSGRCGLCEEILIISCHCGTKQVQKRCDEINKTDRKGFSCDKICGKLLDCGKHRCNEKCHPGPSCPGCKLLSQNIKTCPCGSTQIKKSFLVERKSCTDPIPTCDNRCNRPLICGPDKNRHRCQKKCHSGPCPPCKLKTTVRCDCTLSTKTIDCSLMYERIIDGDQVYFKQASYSFNCEIRCNKPKNCTRHRCQNKCCKAYKDSSGSQLHKCDQVCNKKLPCGLHNCPEPCHPGQCGDCTNIGWEELTCHCGASVLYPPIPCGAKPPACHRLCRRPHSCGHPVSHECHDDTEKCPPCTVFVKKSCFCGAESKDSVYCYQRGYSCGKTCKKQLSCRQHPCKRVCHDNECELPNERGIIICSQPCLVPRFNCKHPCGLPCHGKRPCPQSNCKKITEITCECGNKTERIECHKLMRDVDNRNKVAMLSMNRPNQDSIMIDLSRKSVKESNCVDKKRLDCDETCSIFKRNKALAEALGVAQPDLKPTSIFGEDPLKLLKEATAQDYKFVSSTFNSLVRFIKSAKESDKRFIFTKFPPADKLRREVIHELAHHFNCTSESDGEVPFRHVVVRAYKNKSCVPDFTVEQLLPLTD